MGGIRCGRILDGFWRRYEICIHLDEPIVDPDHDVVLGEGAAGPEQEAVGGGDSHPQVDRVRASHLENFFG